MKRRSGCPRHRAGLKSAPPPLFGASSIGGAFGSYAAPKDVGWAPVALCCNGKLSELPGGCRAKPCQGEVGTESPTRVPGPEAQAPGRFEICSAAALWHPGLETRSSLEGLR